MLGRYRPFVSQWMIIAGTRLFIMKVKHKKRGGYLVLEMIIGFFIHYVIGIKMGMKGDPRLQYGLGL